MSDEFKDPVWDPVLQQWEEEAYFGAAESPVSSSDSAAFNERKANSFVVERDAPEMIAAAASSSNREMLGVATPTDPEAEYSPSTEIEVLYDPNGIRPRPSALNAPPVRGSDVDGPYRLVNGQHLAATVKGRCVHFGECRTLGRHVSGLWITWRSNRVLQACPLCLSRVHSNLMYLVTDENVVHATNQCSGFDSKRKVAHMKGCNICIGI